MMGPVCGCEKLSLFPRCNSTTSFSAVWVRTPMMGPVCGCKKLPLFPRCASTTSFKAVWVRTLMMGPACGCKKLSLFPRCASTPFLTVHLMYTLQKPPYIHCIYMVLANPNSSAYAYNHMQSPLHAAQSSWTHLSSNKKFSQTHLYNL